MRLFRSTLRISVIVSLVLFGSCRNKETLMPVPIGVAVDPWKEAALKVEQDRGQPMGRAANVEIPPQVKHYSDTRRFLAIQIAESRKHELRTPHDFAELIQLIRNRELVEVPGLSDGYILYGVGMSATEDRFAHYDVSTERSVPLFQNDSDLKLEQDQLNQSVEQLNVTITQLRKQLQLAPRRDRDLRQQLQTDLSANENSLATRKREKELLDRLYSNAASRRLLEYEYQVIASQVEQYGVASYRLDDGPSRKALKARLLSYLRPAALQVLKGLAKSYQARFGRPLPVSSLVRTEEYQRQLRGSNPNATSVPTPPHTTGLAFDILYKFMSADEQAFLMAELARLRDEARIEVLRENNDSFHVFAFIEGTRPEESLITAMLDEVGPAPRQPTVNRRLDNRRRATRRGRGRASRRR